MKKTLILLLSIFLYYSLFSQKVYHHISNKNIYSFLDELATEHIISLNSAVKPYSRTFIADKLQEVSDQKENLNQQQLKDLEFYLKDFNKELLPDKNFNKRLDLFYYKDSLFTFSINPIGGLQYWTNKNGSVYHRWNGAEAFAYIGQHWGFYASLRDNHENEILSEDHFLNQRMGGNYKAKYDYSEMRGGVTYSWKWGSLGLIKDHFAWGNNHNGSNIFSGRTPSFVTFNLHLKPVKWLDFHYVHGRIISEVIDSTRSYYLVNNYGLNYREVFFHKFLAANFFTITPFRRFNISFGNSIVYSDLGVYPAYLIPIFFYKSVDHTVNSGIDNQNSQMFFDISSRQIKNLHLYAGLFIDEIAIGRMFKPDEHSNFYSAKAGFTLSNYPLQNFSFTAEYTRTNPLAYRHYVPTITFESNRFNLGHYLMDNAREFYFAIDSRPIRGLNIHLSYTHAQKGPDYTITGSDRLGLPFMKTVEWENKTLALKASYEAINDGFVFAEFLFRDITGEESYTPEFWYGRTSTVSVGVNFGF